MPHFYFHICNGKGFVEDEEGRELPGAEAARATALIEAREVMSHDMRTGELDLSSFIEVEDEAGNLLFTVLFEEAVTFRNRHAGEAPG